MRSDSERDRLIEQLYREMYLPLLAYAQSALRNKALAEDAVQDTFRIACAKPDDLLSSVNPKGWLLNTLKNVIRNIRRSQESMNRLLVKAFSMETERAGKQDAGTDIDILYSDLAENQDFILIKKIAFEKRSISEIADELGISVEACKKRVQRAKQHLKEYFNENE